MALFRGFDLQSWILLFTYISYMYFQCGHTEEAILVLNQWYYTDEGSKKLSSIRTEALQVGTSTLKTFKMKNGTLMDPSTAI